MSVARLSTRTAGSFVHSIVWVVLAALTACAPTTTNSEALPNSPQVSAPPMHPDTEESTLQKVTDSVTSRRAAYEPERHVPSRKLTFVEAQTLVSRLKTPLNKPCEQWKKPLGQRCVVGERDALTALIDSLEHDAFGRDEERSHWLFELEGCSSLPAGLIRWVRMRELPECRVELGESVLSTEAQALDSSLVNIITGEVLAGKCLRSTEPLPRYPYDVFSDDRFLRWRQTKVEPWQQRMNTASQLCRGAIDELPIGDHGRAEAELGYAQALRTVASAYRAAPITRRLAEDYEFRLRFYEALDVIARPQHARVDNALLAVSPHTNVAGEYAIYAEPFRRTAVPRSSFEWLSLSPREPPRSLMRERVLESLPVAASSLLFSPEQLGSQAALRAMLTRGLPQAVRAEIGNQLAVLPAASPERQQVHALLALGLTRMGLVLHSHAALERAAYELSFAGHGVDERWLNAVLRALLTTGARLDVFPDWTHPRPRVPLDISGFTPDLQAIMHRDERYAPLAVDHAILSLGYGPGIADERAIVVAADKKGVPKAVKGCVHEALTDTWGSVEFGGPKRPRCLPYYWLAR